MHVALPLALIQILGSAQIPGDASDGLTLAPQTLEDGTPMDRMGGFGSAITYTGIGSLYLATPDRGPADGTTSWRDRAYLLDIRVDPTGTSPVSMSLVDVIPLVDEDGRGFTGSAAAFDASGSPSSLRFDPEGVRVSSTGTFFVSDEYGPYLYEIDAWGERVGVLPVPESFLIAHAGATADVELPPGNASGRQPNRGMEGLAISPDGTKLYGIMQNALLQDHALDAANKRKGMFNRILEIDLRTHATRELVYPLEGSKNGVNELIAVDDHRFLVLERDGDGGTSAAFKRLYLVDLSAATDVSAIASLPQKAPLPAGVVAASKSLFLDLLDPAFGLAGAGFPEKIEGLAWGPDLDDGRHVLLVTVDNDLVVTTPSTLWAFAIDPQALPGYQAQSLAPAIDVQPGDRRHTVWPRFRLPVAVGILSQGLLDATAIAAGTIRFAGAPVASFFGFPACLPWDLDRDGDLDLYCLIDGAHLALHPGDTFAPLVAETTTGTPVRTQGAITVR